MVKSVLDDHGIQGQLAVITGGWEEREDELDLLVDHVHRPTVNLRLHHRLQGVLAADVPFSQAITDRNDRLRMAQVFYRRRLRSALESVRALHRMTVPRMSLLLAERSDALRAVADLDDHYLTQIRGIHEAFVDLWAPTHRPGVTKVRDEVAAELEDCEAILIAGGHVGALLDQLTLLALRPLMPRHPVIAWSAGAMVMTQQIVLFHDSPPQGQSDPELYDDGLGLAPNVVILPHARARLRLHDETRVSIFSRRFSPAACVTLEEGTGIHWDQENWTPIGPAQRLANDGLVVDVVAP